MNLVLLIVDASGRVVRDEDINMREVLQQARRLILLIEKVASGLVLPGAVESPETDSQVLPDRKVEIHHGARKGIRKVMVAFYRQDSGALISLSCPQDDWIADIATGYQNIGLASPASPFEVINVGYDKEPHTSLFGSCLSSGVPMEPADQGLVANSI